MKEADTWHGHVQRKGEADWVKGCTMMVVEGIVPCGRPKKTWQDCVSEDLRLLGLNTRDAQDCVTWQSEIRRQHKTGFKC